ncbi:MAG: ribonuclease III family protein [Candidatus Thorarchaeota archaeon]
MTMKSYQDEIKKKIRPIMRDHDLAKFGDSLTNFLYSLAKTKSLSHPYGEHVLDKSLAEAIKNLNLRSLMPSSSSAGDIGDGAEALVGYAYLNDLLTLKEMELIIMKIMVEKGFNENYTRNQEREIMQLSFEKLIEEILQRIK